MLKGPGTVAGLLWCSANACITSAVVLGGNAVVIAQYTSSQIIFSGLCGILWYGELKGSRVRAVWGISATVTLAAMVLLGNEKES